MSTRELLAVLRRLVDLNIVGADVVEVAPAYDHAEITAIAAAHVGYELLAIFARRSGRKTGQGSSQAARAVKAPSME
jgi:agmatinase